MRTRPDYYYTQSAVVPYRVRDGRVEILLITSRRSKRWIVPKGIVEADLTPQESAAKEAWEEAGVSGEVDATPLGVYRYEKWGDVCHVTVYALRVEEELAAWPEDFRTREWVSAKEAAKRVREAELKALIEEFARQRAGVTGS